MTSRMKELEELILKGRKPITPSAEGLRRKFAGKGKLTSTEKRMLQAIKRQARKSVDIENMFRDAPSMEITITKGKIPSAEALDRKNVKTTKPKKKKPIRTKGSDAARDRANIKTANIKPKQRPTGPGGTTSLMPKEYTIKKGDTLTAIAKRMGTTVAMLKAANNIKDANKIRAGAKLKIYKGKAPTRKALPPSLKNEPRTIAQAQKMGKKYFYDKKGNKKAAVTAEQLKKSGLSLAQYLKKKK